jgi:hypothetical protein
MTASNVWGDNKNIFECTFPAETIGDYSLKCKLIFPCEILQVFHWIPKGDRTLMSDDYNDRIHRMHKLTSGLPLIQSYSIYLGSFFELEHDEKIFWSAMMTNLANISILRINLYTIFKLLGVETITRSFLLFLVSDMLSSYPFVSICPFVSLGEASKTTRNVGDDNLFDSGSSKSIPVHLNAI